jgi:AcrR family transcriptional regulator
MNIRARKEEDKQARREAILGVVSGCFRGRPFADVTMAEIAQRCGLAKGTLYLYFQAKEELFLAALGCEIAAWLDAVGAELDTRGRTDTKGFAELVVRTLTPRDTLVELLPLQRTLLEQSGASQTATRFTQTLEEKLRTTAAIVERALPLASGEGMRVLLRTLALVVGLRQIPDPTLGTLDGSGTSAVMPADFHRELLDSLTTMLTGMLSSGDVRPRSVATPQPWAASSSVAPD